MCLGKKIREVSGGTVEILDTEAMQASWRYVQSFEAGGESASRSCEKTYYEASSAHISGCLTYRGLFGAWHYLYL